MEGMYGSGSLSIYLENFILVISVLLDEEGNPLGNRITKPIPAKLLDKRDNAQMAKVLALANKYI